MLPELDHRYPTFRFDIDLGRVSRGDRELREEITAEVADAGAGAPSVFAPLGVGRHVDHLLARAVGEHLGAVLYADFPYTARDPHAEAAAAGGLRPWAWTDDLAAKRAGRSRATGRRWTRCSRAGRSRCGPRPTTPRRPDRSARRRRQLPFYPQQVTAPASVRVRFCPSPTGTPHVGLVRTALFNWAYARHTGGTFVFRIEDTDAQRDSVESYAAILDALTWLGLDWDEGPQVGGPHGPYRQSERRDTYRDALGLLVQAGEVYESYSTAEEIEARHRAAGPRPEAGLRQRGPRPHRGAEGGVPGRRAAVRCSGCACRTATSPSPT